MSSDAAAAQGASLDDPGGETDPYECEDEEDSPPQPQPFRSHISPSLTTGSGRSMGGGGSVTGSGRSMGSTRRAVRGKAGDRSRGKVTRDRARATIDRTSFIMTASSSSFSLLVGDGVRVRSCSSAFRFASAWISQNGRDFWSERRWMVAALGLVGAITG